MYPTEFGRNDAPGGGGGLGFMSSPSSNTSGQYTSGGGTPRSVPQARPGQFSQTGQRKKPAPKPKKKPAPKAPSIGKFLAGDTTFQDQSAQLAKQLAQFRASNSSQQNNVKMDFQTALDKLNKQKETDLSALQSDFAARGLLNSGLFTDALGKYNSDFNQQTSELGVDQQRSLQDLIEALGGYSTENSASLAAAKQDAIRRRAQKYGITA